ncbi:MAG: hypothetical protein LBV79_10290 [Candidatus Adiutrix sp.]|jgi:hypothetical protein|nr:hypothetical protein [Candidatus Adiutrix sp.]
MANVKIKGLELPGLKALISKFTASPNPGVKVGVQEGAKYDQGPLAGESVAQNLARHEFGTKDIPARAPFRTTLERKKGDWAKEFAGRLTKVLSGESGIAAALTGTGNAMAMDIQDSFEEGLAPQLKMSTIKQKMRMTREGKLTKRSKKGSYTAGDYAGSAFQPVVLTGTAQQSITAEYVDDISTAGK